MIVRHIFDVENNTDCIEVRLNNKVDYLYTKPKGEWTQLKFAKSDRVDYADFLRTMVVLNLEVARKIAKLELSRTYVRSIRAMRFLNELDGTFSPPYVNKKSDSQMKLVEYTNRVVAWHMIDECDGVYSLIAYANKLRTLLWSP